MSNPKKVEPLKASDRVNITEAVNARLRKLTAPGGVELVGGDGITIENNEISATPYTAGENVTIEDRVISCTAEGKTYTAGDGIEISEDNAISATPYTAGENVTIEDRVISCTAEGKTYTAGTGISISDADVISGNYKAGTGISISSGTISGNYKAGTGISISSGTISGNYKAGTGISISSGTISGNYKAGTGISISSDTISGAYTAGDNVTITNGKIYSKNTEYTAGTGINISSDYVISAEGTSSFTGTVANRGSIGITLADGVHSYVIYGVVLTKDLMIVNTKLPAGTYEAGKTYDVASFTNFAYSPYSLAVTAKLLYPIGNVGFSYDNRDNIDWEWSDSSDFDLQMVIGDTALTLESDTELLFAIPCKPITS